MIVADVAKIDTVEDEWAAAARTEFRVGAVAQLRLQQCWIVQPRIHDPRQSVAQRRHHRIVGVEHGGHTLGALYQRAPDVRRRRLQLTVAVELVAEQVGHDDGPGRDFLDEPRQARLIDFEQPNIRVQPAGPGGAIHHGRGDAIDQVGARLVGDGSPALRLENVPQKGRRRRLSVRAGDHHRPLIERAGERGQNFGIDPAGDIAGECRPAASSQAATQTRGQLAGPERRHRARVHGPATGRQSHARNPS